MVSKTLMKHSFFQLLHISNSQLEFARIRELCDAAACARRARKLRRFEDRSLLCSVSRYLLSRHLRHWLNSGCRFHRFNRFRRRIQCGGGNSKIRHLLLLGSLMLELLSAVNRRLNRLWRQVKVAEQVAQQIHVAPSSWGSRSRSRGGFWSSSLSSWRSMILWCSVPWSLELSRSRMPWRRSTWSRCETSLRSSNMLMMRRSWRWSCYRCSLWRMLEDGKSRWWSRCLV